MTQLDTNRLADLVAQKLRCLEQLRRLSQQQEKLLGDGNMDQLLVVLAGKQRLLNFLAHVEQQLEPYRAQDPEQRTWSTPQDRQRCAEMISACEKILAEIVAGERECEGRLKLRRDETAEKLAGVHAAGHARAAYGAQPPASVTNLDLTSSE